MPSIENGYEILTTYSFVFMESLISVQVVELFCSKKKEKKKKKDAEKLIR